MVRDLCNLCKKRPVAINYHKNNKTFYRSKCDHCSKNRKIEKPLWTLSGYKKKNVCDKCGFTSKIQEQFSIFYVDGSPKNCRPNNLKTICENCKVILYKFKSTWKQGDLKPDF